MIDLNINLFPIDKISFGPTVAGTGYIGPTEQKTFNNPADLQISWQELETEAVDQAALLSWHTRASNFRGRDDEMAELTQWAMNEKPVSVKFITGAGGAGKSRLAAEFADHIQIRHDWSGGFVDLRNPTTFKLNRAGTLLIIDYPEEYKENVAEIFRDLARLDQTALTVDGQLIRIKVLFVTRQQIKDWHEIIIDNKAAPLVNMKPITLGSLDLEAAQELFNSALIKASEILRVIVPPLSEEMMAAWLKQAPENDLALFIVAAAVHNALYPEEEVIRYSGRKMVELLADRENSRLRQISRNNGLRDNFCACLKAMATICNSIPINNLTDMLEAAGLHGTVAPDADLQSCLRHTGLVADEKICALKPDIIAAAFTVNALDRQDSPPAPDLLWHALKMDMAGGLNRLARLHHDAESVLGIHEPTLGQWLVEAVRGRPGRSAGLEPFLAHPWLPRGLIPAAVAANEALIAVTTAEKEKARLNNNLGNHYSELGRREEALEATSQTVKIRESLAKDDPGAFRPDLAASLNNLGNCYAELGRREEALEATSQTVKIYESLAKDEPGAFRPSLAGSLNNLGLCYSALGRREEALKATCRAVKIYVSLAEDEPGTFRPDLAMSLNNQGRRYAELGRREEALKATSRAVKIYASLAENEPGAFRPDLAMSLNNQGNCYAELGRREEALKAASRAVKIYESLAEDEPGAFKPGLAGSLRTIGTIYSAADQHLDAHDAFLRGVKVLTQSFRQYPKGTGTLMNMLLRDYRKECRTLNRDPDESVLLMLKDLNP